MSILFSPIGTADPITQLGDGPMLHIVRHYAPSKVVLFLTPVMAGHQRDDGRYTKAIELLCASEGRPLPEIELVESAYEDVFRFDHYIAEFEALLEGLVGESDAEPVLVNASSGTPAMEQALVALGSFGRLNLKLLQVVTPRRGVNKSQDREDPNTYDLQELWAWNEDLRADEPDAPCRVIEVETPNFADRLLRENVIALVERYEYEAAYELACQMTCANPKAVEMIRAAADRLNLNRRMPAKVFGGTELSYKDNDLLFEYLAIMEVRLAQGHWADFIRSMSPALSEISKRCLRPYLPENKYLIIENGVPTNRINYEAISQDRMLRDVIGSRDYSSSMIKSVQLVNLVKWYCEDGPTKDKIFALRKVEDKCRNTIAHEVGPMDKRQIEQEGGLSLETVMQYFFDLHGSMKPGLYARISKAIVDLL